MSKKLKLLALSGTAALACVGGTAHASGTAAGTVISNTASVSYKVNGSDQSVNSSTATFVVDKKVAFTTVLDQSGSTKVNLGQTGAYATFKITNSTNSAQDFLLDADQLTIPLGLLSGTDNYNLANFKAFVDKNGNGVYDEAIDVDTYIDELGADQSVKVFLVGDVPTDPATNNAWTSLHVTVAEGGQSGTKGAALIPTLLNLANADNQVDIVFADDDSDGVLYAGDIERNGQGRAYVAFEVGNRNVALTVSKTARVISDGVNVLNPKAIPGAVVEYCFVVANGTLGTPANNIVINDVIPTGTTYVPSSTAIGGVAVGGTCLLNGTPQDDATAFDAGTKTVHANVGTVLGGLSSAASFRVTID